MLTNGTTLTRKLFWLSLLLLPLAAEAIIFEPLAIDVLTQRAEVVALGTVVSKTCQADPSGRIYTQVELEVTDVWKGAIPGSPLRLVQSGGILGEKQAVVSGQPEYEPGEEVVAFLVRNDRGQLLTLGLMQGKFHVWKDPASGLKLASNPFHGLPESTAARVRVQSAATGASVPGSLPLAELKRRVVEARP